MNNITRLFGLFTLVCALVVTTVCPVNGQDFLTNGLVGFYPFSGNANDASGNGNNAVSYGAQLATNRFGIAYDSYSVANGSYIETTNSVGFPTSTNDFTVSVWVNFSTLPVPPAGIAMIFANKAIDQFQLALNPTVGTSGFFDFWTGGNHGAPADCHTTTNVWTVNRWYNLVVLRSQNTVSIYQDGAIIGQNQTTFGNNAAAASRKLDFGYRSSPGCCPLSGQLDDIRIYNRALSASELAQLYSIEVGLLNIRKAVYVDKGGLAVGLNYQLQVSSDLINWTNQGAPFTATNSYWRSTDYWDVDDWNQLFFRLLRQ